MIGEDGIRVIATSLSAGRKTVASATCGDHSSTVP